MLRTSAACWRSRLRARRRTRPLRRLATVGACAPPSTPSGSVGRVPPPLYPPLSDELPAAPLVARLCAEAEEAGWHGVFVWDHVRWHEPVVDVADTQIALAAIASATDRIRLGPMVTPLARRRPRQRPVRQRILDHGRGARRTQARTDARRSARDPPGRLVWRVRGAPRRALHGRLNAVPAAARPAPRRADLGRGVLRQVKAATPGAPLPGLLPRRPRAPR